MQDSPKTPSRGSRELHLLFLDMPLCLRKVAGSVLLIHYSDEPHLLQGCG